MIERKDVTGPNSFEYIRKQLSMGGTLSNYINILSIESGKAYSFVPSDTLEENLYNFDLGGIYPFDKELLKTQRVVPVRNDAKSLVLSEIQNHLSINETNCCLFEDPVGAPSDPWVESSGIEYVHLNNKEMFYFFDCNNNVVEKINKAFVRSEDYIFLCGLSSMDINDRNKFAVYKEVDLELLVLFVRNLSTFFVKAYDGEGYLMWIKS